MMGMTQDPLVHTPLPDFSLRFDDSIGSVSCSGSGVSVPIGVNSKCDIFTFVVCCTNRIQIQRWLTH